MIWRKPRHFACIIHSNSSPHPPSCASQPQPKRTSVNRDHFVSLFSCSSVPTPVTGNGLGPWLSLLPFLRIHRSPTRSRLAPIIIALTFNARYLPNLISFLFLRILFKIVPTTSEFIILPPTIRRPLISHFLSRIPPSRFLKIPSVIGHLTVSDNETLSSVLQLSPTIVLYLIR